MKKIIFIIVFFIAFMTNINALERFHFAERVPNMYSEERSNGNVYSGAIYMIRRSDGVPVYCINPFELLDENKYYKEYYVNDSRFNLTDEQIDRINLIGYYGYNY